MGERLELERWSARLHARRSTRARDHLTPVGSCKCLRQKGSRCADLPLLILPCLPHSSNAISRGNQDKDYGSHCSMAQLETVYRILSLRHSQMEHWVLVFCILLSREDAD